MKAGRVRTLHYAVNWVDQHPVSWLEDAFPASYEVGGWTLTLSEARLDALPSQAMSEDEARSALTPILDTWSAAIEVEQRLVVTFFYLGADVEQDTAGPGTAASGDFASASGTAFNATVAIRRDTPPEPDWSWRDTDVTRLARSMCLRPLRNGSRTVDDAAYWLSTHLKPWAGSDHAAAHRLNVSSGYFERARQWGARSAERKVSRDSQTLTTQEKEQLKSISGGRRTRILHLGDYDQSGEHMFSSLAEDVIAFAEAAGAEVAFERVAVTPEQIATYNLPTAPPKATDRRSFSGTTTTQAEALPPDILAAIVREAIEAHRNPDVHRQALAREEAERQEIRQRLNGRPEPGQHPAE